MTRTCRFERGVTYVNIADMTRDLPLAQLLLAPVIDPSCVVLMEGDRMDGVALPLRCPQERADAIIAVCRMKWHRNHFRFYRGGKRI